jgi:hypothetical protein
MAISPVKHVGAWIAVVVCVSAPPALGQNQQLDRDARLPNPQVNPTGQPVAPSGGGEAPIAFWLGHARSDNAARTSGRGRGSYNAAGTMFNLARDRGRFEGSLVGSLEYRAYADEIGEDERVGNLAATADVAIVPERFSWLIGESYVQGRSDPFGADTLENRENVSVFATGPDVNLPIGDRTSLGLSGTYSERTYGESVFLDSEVVTGQFGVYRQARPTTVVGIAGETTDVDYKAEATPGYDIEAAYLSYERSLASGSVFVNVGGNELIAADNSVREPYFELNWARALTGRSRFTLTATSGFTDSGRLLELRPDQVAIDVLLTSDATNRREVALEYELDLDRTSVVVGAAALSDEFEQNTALDSDGQEKHLEITRTITPLMTLGLGLLEVSRDFMTTGQENEETFARLWLNRRFGQNFSLEAHVQRSEHPGIYTERLYQATLVYSLGRGRAPSGAGRGSGGAGRAGGASEGN